MDIFSLSTDLLMFIVRRYLEVDDEENFGLVCRAWRDVRDDARMWAGARLGTVFHNNKLSRAPFRFFGVRAQGTEGLCCKVQFRGDQSIYAMKKARVYPKGEGVPYYMLREIEFLRGLNHPNVSILKAVALSSSELFMFFPYAPRTLHEALNSPPNEPNEPGIPLPIHITKRFLYQILKGVLACHERGVLHRNIKPKHLLLYDNKNPTSSLHPRPMNWELDVKTPVSPEDLERCNVCLSDFALVRTSLQPLRRFTPEVVTLWYRAPEVLLGGQYFTSVDMWAVGCVFAEMLCGKPFFAGVCEVNQLFEIFNKVGTPTEETWPGFSTLPNISFQYPNWPRLGLKRYFPTVDSSTLDLLERILEVDPAKRISAREALGHPFFDDAFLAREGVSKEEHLKISQMPAYSPNFELQGLERKIGLANPKTLRFYLSNMVQVERESSSIFLDRAVLSPLPPDYTRLRYEIVQKLIEVVEIFEMSTRTEFLAVTLMDRFLAKRPMYIEKNRMIGTTFLHIASKCEDVSYIGVADLIALPLGHPQEEPQKQAAELLELQEKVLNVLEFRLAVPTVLDFLQGFLYGMELDRFQTFSQLMSACTYFAELSLLELQFTSFLPSCTAAAIVAYSCLFFEPLTDAQFETLLNELANCSPESFKMAFKLLAETHGARPDTHNLALKRRYMGRAGPIFVVSVKWEAYIRSRWTYFASRELPIGVLDA